MDPYDFAENGYRCTVTIGRLVPNVSWWFPSCNRCSKSCVPDGSGYRCNGCSTNSFRFKYKISFVALDGTDEAEMVCFGDVARRIIGKPVQQILRTATNANTYPPDVTKMVSLRFTFQVSLTQQSYYRQQKTYQVVSVVTSHGQPNAIPHAPVNEDGAHPSTPESDHSLTAATDDGSELVTPNSVTDGGVPSPVATNRSVS
ncbi:replication protein A 70 kDa DNA-binding subunit B-like [Miscanthus floridulus]|uniref:replication protein A 70 kDa DNA-binding subunit B-like n=1 Tax=Miscanthus floridulus TaxID=154761 RepID=UPI003457D436